MNATKITLIATIAVLALYVFAMINSDSDVDSPAKPVLETGEN